MAAKPTLVYQGSDPGEEDNSYMNDLINAIPLLNQKYKPPPVWGTSGHIQTAVYSMMEKRPGLDLSGLCSNRYSVRLQDGSTVFYDVFAASDQKDSSESNEEADVTIVFCPGLASTVEHTYVKSFVSLATQSGYRVVVLNHLGMLTGETITTHRVFNLGSTEEYGAVVSETLRLFRDTRLIALGMSLGGGLVCKYLGENLEMQKHFIACISLCQGYDYLRVLRAALGGSKTRLFYGQQLTKKVQESMAKNWNVLKTHPRLSQIDSELEVIRSQKKIMRKSLSVSARLSKAFSSSSSADSLKRISSQDFRSQSPSSCVSALSIPTNISSNSLKHFTTSEHLDFKDISTLNSEETTESQQSNDSGIADLRTAVFEALGDDSLDIIENPDEGFSQHICYSPGASCSTPVHPYVPNDNKSEAKFSQRDSDIDPEQIKKVKSPLLSKILQTNMMNELDQMITIKTTGHDTIDEYYAWASACNYMDKIDIPTLYVNAKDDPLWTKHLLLIPAKRAKSHRDTLFVMTEHGGHLGFFTKTGRTSVDPYTWLERMTIQYMDALLRQHKVYQKQCVATVPAASEREAACLTLTPPNKNTHHEDLTASLLTQLRLKPCRSQYEINATKHNPDSRKTANLLAADINSNNIRTLTGSDYNLRSEIEKESKSRAAEKLKTSYSASLLETLGGEVHV